MGTTRSSLKGRPENAQARFIDSGGRLENFSACLPCGSSLFNVGASLCFASLDRSTEQLKQLGNGFADLANLPGTIKYQLLSDTPVIEKQMNCDCQHRYFIQMPGEKRWGSALAPPGQDAVASVTLPISSKQPSVVVDLPPI